MKTRPVASTWPAAPSPAASVSPCQLVGDVVAGGRDAAGLGVAEVDAGDVAVDGQRRLARQRAQHLAELQRRVERARGAHQRLVLAGAGAGARLGLEPGEARRGQVGERDGRARARRRSARAARGRSRSPRGGPRRPRLTGTNSTEAASKRSTRSARSSALPRASATCSGAPVRDHPRRPGRAAVVERLDVALVLAALVAHHVAVAGRRALGDLEDQDLVDRERVVERVGQRRADAVGVARRRRRARERRCRHAATAPGAWSRWASGVGGAGIGSGTAEPPSCEGHARLSAARTGALDAANRPLPRSDAGVSRRRGSARRSPRTARASEPAGGAVSFEAESSSAGAVAPPLSVPAVSVPAAPCRCRCSGRRRWRRDWSPGAVVLPGSAVAVGVGRGVRVGARAGRASTVSDGIATSTGGPGTSS